MLRAFFEASDSRIADGSFAAPPLESACLPAARLAHRAHIASTVARLHRTPPAPAAHTLPCPLVHPAGILKLRAYNFLQTTSNFVVSLPNVSENDVKGLLFRKQPLHTSPKRLKEGKKRNLFPFLKNPTLSLDCAREWRVKASAPIPRDSTNWLQSGL